MRTPVRLFTILFSMCIVLPLTALAPENDKTGQKFDLEKFQTEFRVQPLKGLDGIVILVEVLSSDAQHAGLKRDQLIRDVELRFRKYGIPIKEVTVGSPYLYVNVNFMQSRYKSGERAEAISYSIDLEFIQSVNLTRNPSTLVANGVTWSTHSLGITFDDPRLVRMIRDKLDDQIDVFINDYLLANPVVR